jgi:uncharacterized protein
MVFSMVKVYCQDRVVAKNVVFCNNIFMKGKGLMFTTKKAVLDTAWFFPFRTPQRIAVTMFFVFYPIDVVFLDKDNIIVEIKEDFKPFHNYNSKKKISSFLEFSCGTVKKHSMIKGNKISFK